MEAAQADAKVLVSALYWGEYGAFQALGGMTSELTQALARCT